MSKLFGLVRAFFSLGSLKTALYAIGGVIVAALVFLSWFARVISRGEQNKQLKRQLEAQRDARDILRRQRDAAARTRDPGGLRESLRKGDF